MATDANQAAEPAENAVPPGYYRDAQGRLIPATLMKPASLLEDQLVKNVMERAKSLASLLATFKIGVFEDVDAFQAILSADYGGKRGGTKGNITLTSFDGLMRVQVAVSERMTFGAELQVAKALIDECITVWGKGADEKLRVLVDHAFQVDKEGQVSRERIFALRRVNIEDERWNSAMKAIADSIRIDGTRTYVRFYTRETPQSPWSFVSLDLASA